MGSSTFRESLILEWNKIQSLHPITLRSGNGKRLMVRTFPDGHCEYLRFEGSDHRPIVVHFDVSLKKKEGLV